MNRMVWKSKIGFQLFLVILAALTSALIFYIFLNYSMSKGLDYYFDETLFAEKQTRKTADEFQSYITEKSLSSTDTKEITAWIKKKGFIIISLYKDAVLFYDSLNPDAAYHEADRVIMSDWITESYPIKFSDIEVSLVVDGYLVYPFYVGVYIVSIVLAFILFFSIVMRAVSRRIFYIRNLEEQVQVLAGGELDFPIQANGKDELASLSVNLEEMRKSLLEKMSAEENIRREKESLVTAMSHDLRTPLTTQIGYLEIICNKKYKTEEQREEYTQKVLDKAYQMKKLSDHLFESFLDSSHPVSQEETMELDLPAPASQTLMELLGDFAVYLGEQGFSVQKEGTSQNCLIQISMEYMLRVLDNILSNIIKYASRDFPVVIKIERNKKELLLHFSNQVKTLKTPEESNKIGLANMEDLMKRMKGGAAVSQSFNEYCLTLTFPVIK